MSNSFDPYHRWLGIPPKDQPPNYYRLLGVEIFESDLDVIAAAADRQATYVKVHQIGEHADLSQQILNELAAARVCLLDLDRKARYDDALTSGRPPTSESYSIQQDEALELPEQPEDESPFAAKILDAGEPTSEEWDARIEDLAGLHESLNGEETIAEPEQPEVAAGNEAEPQDVQADDEGQSAVQSGAAFRLPMPGPTKADEFRGAIVPSGRKGQGETATASDRLFIWTTAMSFLAVLCVLGIAAWMLQSPEASTPDGVATNPPVPSGASAGPEDSVSAVPAEEASEPIEPAELNPGEDAKPSPPTPNPPTVDIGYFLDPIETAPVAAEPSAWPWQGNWDAQVARWTDDLNCGTEDAHALVQRGVALCKNRDLDGAMADFDRAIEINPALARAYYNRGVAWIVAGDYDAAISDLDKAIELEPLYGMAYTHRGLAYERKGLTALAQIDYAKASKMWDHQPDGPKRDKSLMELELEYYRKRAVVKQAIRDGEVKPATHVGE